MRMTNRGLWTPGLTKSLKDDTQSGNQDADPVMNRVYLYGPFSWGHENGPYISGRPILLLFRKFRNGHCFLARTWRCVSLCLMSWPIWVQHVVALIHWFMFFRKATDTFSHNLLSRKYTKSHKLAALLKMTQIKRRCPFGASSQIALCALL